jgi:hypothetical protein
VPLAENASETAETTYKWVVRMLYLAAIGISVYYQVEHYRESPEGQVALADLRRRWEKVRAPVLRRRRLRRAETEVQLEAWRIVEEARSTGG